MGQAGALVVLTGLPGAGKTEIAYALERRLFDLGYAAVVVDPHDERGTGGGPRGSTPPHAPELAQRLVDAGVIAIFAFGAPLSSDREAIMNRVGKERCAEVFVSTPEAQRRRRDTRGAYDSHGPLTYEAPRAPFADVSLADQAADEIAAGLVDQLQSRLRLRND